MKQALCLGMTDVQLERCRKRLEQFLADLLAPVGRSERRHWGAVYVRGLLLDGERKSVELMATRGVMRLTNRPRTRTHGWRGRVVVMNRSWRNWGNVLIENRNGLVVDTALLPCSGMAERHAAMIMAERVEALERITLAADKGYDTRDFVKEMRGMNVTPHVAQNTKRQGGSAIDSRRTRHDGYQVSQRKRKRIEELFGWVKTVGTMRKTRHRGMETVAWVFTFMATAYNLVRMRNLIFPAFNPCKSGENCVWSS